VAPGPVRAQLWHLLIEVSTELGERRVGFRSLTAAIDTGTAAARFTSWWRWLISGGS